MTEERRSSTCAQLNVCPAERSETIERGGENRERDLPESRNDTEVRSKQSIILNSGKCREKTIHLDQGPG
jgi:hypothetical protein